MNRKIIISHFEEENVEERINLLFDYHVQKNLNHVSMQLSREELEKLNMQRITGNQETLRFFVLKLENQQVIGNCWISGIDWVEQTCELSISIFPEFRIGYGFLALLEMYEYLYLHLNMKTVVNQTLEGNDLLLAQNNPIKEIAVISKWDSFTFGRYRSSYLWKQTVEEYMEIGKIRSKRIQKLKSELTRELN